jgi:hypothetical protein
MMYSSNIIKDLARRYMIPVQLKSGIQNKIEENLAVTIPTWKPSTVMFMFLLSIIPLLSAAYTSDSIWITMPCILASCVIFYLVHSLRAMIIYLQHMAFMYNEELILREFLLTLTHLEKDFEFKIKDGVNLPESDITRLVELSIIARNHITKVRDDVLKRA